MVYRIRRSDGTIVIDRWVRVLRPLAYFCFGLAGVLLWFSPILLAVLGTLAIIMSVFLAGGGMLAFYGSVTDRWIGEFIGLPLLVAAFIVFGLIQFFFTLPETPYIASANLGLMLGVASILASRWREVKAVFRVAEANATARARRG